MTENVFRVGGGNVPPILILGKDSVEIQKRLDSLKSALDGVEASLQETRAKKAAAEKSLDDHCIKHGAEIRSLLRGPGSSTYANYNKASYKTRAQTMSSNKDASNHELDESTQEDLISQYRASARSEVKEIEFLAPDFVIMSEKVADLLSDTVVSQTIQSLKADVEVSEWVRLGLNLHKGRDTSKCLFCEQPLPSQRISSLEQHFNTAYETLINSLDEMIGEIVRVSERLARLDLPHTPQFYEHLIDDYELVKSQIEAYIEQGTTYLKSLSAGLSEKKVRIFDSLPLDGAGLQLPDSAVFDQLSRIIQKHNKACENHQAEVNKAGIRLENAIVAEKSEEFNLLSAKVEDLEEEVNLLTEKAKSLRTEISSLEVQISEHRRPAEEFNDDLHKYLGHQELRLEVKDNGYVVTRNSVPATQLSEGEITAFALLYFLKSLTDHRFGLPNGVVVLDDPISSLDANSLFLAYGFIKERTGEANQLFILTHNFTLFRQVRNWFHHLKGQRKKDVHQRPARFYMLNCQSDKNGRYSNFQALDPLLERFESDYQYLFSRVVASASSQPQSLESNYLLPNVARRLLEAFLAFRQPDVTGDLWDKMQDLNFDTAKKTQILRFVHTYSHNDVVVEPDHDLSLLSEAQNVLSNLLELIEEEDPQHFNRMMKLVNAPDEDEDE